MPAKTLNSDGFCWQHSGCTHTPNRASGSNTLQRPQHPSSKAHTATDIRQRPKRHQHTGSVMQTAIHWQQRPAAAAPCMAPEPARHKHLDIWPVPCSGIRTQAPDRTRPYTPGSNMQQHPAGSGPLQPAPKLQSTHGH